MLASHNDRAIPSNVTVSLPTVSTKLLLTSLVEIVAISIAALDPSTKVRVSVPALKSVIVSFLKLSPNLKLSAPNSVKLSLPAPPFKTLAASFQL